MRSFITSSEEVRFMFIRPSVCLLVKELKKVTNRLVMFLITVLGTSHSMWANELCGRGLSSLGDFPVQAFSYDNA